MRAFVGTKGDKISKIGKDVFMIETSPGNARNGEGSFIRLDSGAIMYAYTEYTSDDWLDHAEARICAYFSYDEGENWQDKRVLIEKKPEEQNIMSVSLMRMANGDIGMFYCMKIREDGITHCIPVLARSGDEGISWSEAIRCVADDNYYVLNNDRVIRLKSGRILLSVALHDHRKAGDDEHNYITPGVVKFLASDDDGYNWKMLDCTIKSPFDDAVQLQEPGLYQHENGDLWLWMRTAYGCQYQAFSEDDGESWTSVEPNLFFTSPCSPLSVKKVGEYTVSVFNPVPTYLGREMLEPSARTPLMCAICSDDAINHDGESFDRIYYLEDDRENGYCYTAIFGGEDYFLAAYYHSNGTSVCLNSTKFVKVKFSELTNADGENIVKGKIF